MPDGRPDLESLARLDTERGGRDRPDASRVPWSRPWRAKHRWSARRISAVTILACWPSGRSRRSSAAGLAGVSAVARRRRGEVRVGRDATASSTRRCRSISAPASAASSRRWSAALARRRSGRLRHRHQHGRARHLRSAARVPAADPAARLSAAGHHLVRHRRTVEDPGHRHLRMLAPIVAISTRRRRARRQPRPHQRGTLAGRDAGAGVAPCDAAERPALHPDRPPHRARRRLVDAGRGRTGRRHAAASAS